MRRDTINRKTDKTSVLVTKEMNGSGEGNTVALGVEEVGASQLSCCVILGKLLNVPES